MTDQANKLRDIIKSRKISHENPPRFNLSSRVITITSGKGGVGKTNFAINLALQLRKHNKKVVIIDADFGLANIEVLFGIIPRSSFADVVEKNKSMSEVLTEGPQGIKFISGGSGLGELANLSNEQMYEIINSLAELDKTADFILIDTGAGISKSVVNFVIASEETIVITTPEPTSITDAYSIIKTVKEVNSNIPEFKIIVNKTDSLAEGEEIFEKLNKVSERFLDIPLKCLGSVPYDNHLVKAVKRQEPVSICFPNSEVSKSIENIALALLDIEVGKRIPNDGIKAFIRRLTSLFGG